jgi:hypothetical protein
MILKLVTLFMAGGPGSGKGTTLAGLFNDEGEKPKFIYDQTFSGPGTITQIHAVLDHNLAAHVLYVHRPVELATIGIVARYLDPKGTDKRAVPLDYIADRHFNSQHTFRDLLHAWANDAERYQMLSLDLADNTSYGHPSQRLAELTFSPKKTSCTTMQTKQTPGLRELMQASHISCATMPAMPSTRPKRPHNPYREMTARWSQKAMENLRRNLRKQGIS